MAPPPNPCRGCKYEGCRTAGLINRLAVENWLQEKPFDCPDYEEENFRGLEGCYA